MPSPLHTIIGSNGAVGQALQRQLAARFPDQPIRTVSRSTSTSPAHISASCLDREAIVAACASSTIIYLVVGLPYSKAVWKRDWPIVTANVIEACRRADATLVFADNLYCYGDVGNAILTTELPYTTSGDSVKSLARADVVRMIEGSGIRYAIVRGSDFYGAGATSVSHFGDYVVPPLLKGETAKFVVDMHRRHALTHPNDFARALMIAGSDPRALGRAWHVPNAPAATFAEYARMIAEAVQAGGGPAPAPVFAARLMPPFLQALLKPFVGLFAELRDMKHVWDRDYLVDDSAFMDTFGAEFGAPTELSVGFRELVDAYRAKADAK